MNRLALRNGQITIHYGGAAVSIFAAADNLTVEEIDILISTLTLAKRDRPAVAGDSANLARKAELSAWCSWCCTSGPRIGESFVIRNDKPITAESLTAASGVAFVDANVVPDEYAWSEDLSFWRVAYFYSEEPPVERGKRSSV